MIKTFIERPVLSTVISIFIVLLGILGIYSLPITQYPDIAPPTIMVSARYAGADAATVIENVIIPIEEQVNGVEGLTYISSTADNNGGAIITIFFKQGVDPDIAAVNVQNRVARTIPLLPADVTRAGVVTQKQQTSALMFLSFYSTNKSYDDVFIQNYLGINVVPALKRINGVGDASVFGSKSYSMRIWLDPQKLSAFNLVPADIVQAINDQSRQAAPGQLGQNSGEAFQYVIKYSGRLNEVNEYKNIIIKVGQDGQLLRLSDVADIELSALSYSMLGETNGYPSLTLAVYQTPGSNARQIIEDIKSNLIESQKEFPQGLEYSINYDTNEFLSASIESVLHTLLEAFILVFIVVFIFLQDFRSTLIPAIAVPVSIVGTFFFLNLFGFSINLLTLFALILAIGIVVDDAIVVVEAVHAKMNKEPGRSIKEVTTKAMGEISAAIISITLVMAAVFIPVTFIPGPSGVFYKQFGITLVVAIVISAVNALTLSPMLCALVLKPHDKDPAVNESIIQRFYLAFNTAFEKFTNKYCSILPFLIARKWLVGVIIAGAALGIFWANKTTPSGFVPNEDRKLIFANIELPPASSLDRTYAVLKNFQQVARQIPGIEDFSYIIGTSLISGSGNNYALGFLKLTDWAERKGKKEETVEAITYKLFDIASQFTEAQMIFFSPPSVPGFGNSAGFELQLLDKTGGTPAELDKVTKAFLAQLNVQPEIFYGQSSFNTGYPQYNLKINVPLAMQKGVSVSEILNGLSGYIGGVYAADFTKYGKQFSVMIQAKPENRNDLQSLNKIYVRNFSGEMLPVTIFVNLEEMYGPQVLNRFNLYNSASVSGAQKPGYSTGDAIQAVRRVAATTLPNGYTVDFSGLTREEIGSGSQTSLIFLITLVFVFLLLAIQYESYVLPLAILFSLPLGVMGAYLSQKFAGLENNIFFQIALIMLLGLLAKNAILIVEFALHERMKGHSIAKAAIMGAQERLRPILMTSFAFILGLMPLVLSKGIGSNGNRSLATGAAFGLLIGTFLGLLVIPTLFVIFQTIQERIKPLNIKTIEDEKAN